MIQYTKDAPLWVANIKKKLLLGITSISMSHCDSVR